MNPVHAEGELQFSSVEGTRLHLVARQDMVRMEARDLRSAIRSWRALRSAGVRPLRSAGEVARRFDLALELSIGGRTVARRRRGPGERVWPRLFNLFRVVFGGTR